MPSTGVAQNVQEDSDQQFRLMVESVQDYAIFMLDPDGHIDTWNAGAKRIKGYEADEIIGQHFSKFYPRADVIARKPWRELEVALAEGRVEDEGWRVRKDGTQFWASVVITALWDSAGVLRGFAKVTRDLTERKRAEEESAKLEAEKAARVAAESANRRLAFLAESSQVLNESLVYEVTLARVAELAVPRIADWCTVFLINDGGDAKAVAVRHVDEAKTELLRGCQELCLQKSAQHGPLRAVLETGRSDFQPAITDAAGAPLLRMTSTITVPLTARGRVLGALQVAYGESGRQYEALDLTMAEDLGRRVGMAIDNARLHRETHETLARLDQSYEALRESEALLAGQKAILEAIAKGTPLADVLKQVVAFIEQRSPDTLCAIHLVDASGLFMCCAAAPNLPKFYRSELRRVPATPAEVSGDGTSWVVPLVGSQEELVGTLTLVGGHGHEPGDIADKLASISAHLLAIAIERSRAEESRDLKLQTLVAHMAEGIIAVDNAGRILLANATAHQLLGLDSPMEGLPLAQTELPGPVREALDQASEPEGPGAFRLLLPRGQLELEVYVSPVATEFGRYGALALLKDATRELQLQRLQNSFVANVSHELRGPLASVSAVVEAFRDGLIAEPARERYLSSIIAEIRRLRRLTDQLLELSKLDAGMARLKPSEFSLSELCEGLGELWRYQCANAGVQLTVESPPVHLVADRDAVEQVLINLLENAVRFTPSGGAVSLVARVDRDRVRIAVVDSGAGIPAEHIPYIWEPFYKADQARTLKPNSGTGLGLSISKRLVEQMGGEIRVESSEAERRTVFHVVLPLK
jgi:PAS domain S-box-containing protein